MSPKQVFLMAPILIAATLSLCGENQREEVPGNGVTVDVIRPFSGEGPFIGVTLLGVVNRPGAYDLPEGVSVEAAYGVAGGPPLGFDGKLIYPWKIYVKRPTPDGPKYLVVFYRRLIRGLDDDIRLLAGDVVVFSEIE